MIKKIIFTLSIIFSFFVLSAQQLNLKKPSSESLKNKWNAKWITSAVGSTHDVGVYHFRKSIELTSTLDSFIINISGDQRYEFFVNGKRICRGPATGDILHWYFETVDIAPFLNKGKNTLSATVWNYGIWSPGAQVSQETGLIVQGNSKTEEIVNTNSTWKVLKDEAYKPSISYMQDVGPGDIIDGRKYPWHWNERDFDDSTWQQVAERDFGTPVNSSTQYIRALLPRDIPLLKSEKQFLNSVRRTKNISVGNGFLKADSAIIIPANSIVTLLFDHGFITNAYPTFSFSKGKDSKISVVYSESMYLNNSEKGNRNEVDAKFIIGKIDSFYIDGGETKNFSPLWYRTYRYVEMKIETNNEPLIFNSITAETTGYPFKENAKFTSNDNQLSKIWEMGWRTATLCAGDTYYDCPYYEQLQYTGDTRIQALISLYVSGDDRLMRKAINNLSWSKTSDGILKSRYPARYDQVIPPFSLFWINMLHDFWMLRDDKEFVKSHLNTVKSIIYWYADKIDKNTGMLGAMPHWNFVDWPKEWPWNNKYPLGGVPPGGMTGGSSIISLQLAYTLGDAIDLMKAYDMKFEATKFEELKNLINKSVKQNCFDTSKGLIADDIKRTSYSQHASIMGILSGSLNSKEELQVFNKLTADKSLIQATVYYQFYLFRALKKVGLANEYLSKLGDWYNMINTGLTTFAERPEPSRSDCHAWSASPIYDLLSTVCGIEPASPGFKTIQVAPALGDLSYVKASMPHPNGNIYLDLRKVNKRLVGIITLPNRTKGFYKYGNMKLQLNQGVNYLK